MGKVQWVFSILFLFPLIGIGQTVLGTSNIEQANAILALEDGTLLLTGKCRTAPEKDLDIFLLHLTRAGQFLSSRTFGGPNQDEGLWLEPTHDGGIILAGYAFEKDGGFGRHDIYILKFDAELNLEWERLYGRAFREIPFCIRVIENGYVIGGYTKSQGLHGDYFLMSIDKDGNELWDHYYEAPFVDIGQDVGITEDGYLIVGSTAGYYFPSQANHHYPESNVMVIQTDLQGREVGRCFYGGERHQFAKSILRCPGKEGWFIFGSSQDEISGDFDFLLIRLDNELNEQWSKHYGGKECDQGSMMQLVGNMLLLNGTFEENGKFKAGVIVVDLDGNELGNKKVELSFSSHGTGISRVGPGEFFGTGYVVKNELDRDILIFSGDIQSISKKD